MRFHRHRWVQTSLDHYSTGTWAGYVFVRYFECSTCGASKTVHPKGRKVRGVWEEAS